MRYLSVEEVLVLHDYQIERFGGSHGLLSLPLLESAIGRPTANFSGKDLYVDVYEKAAVLVYSLVKNHPFLDGNKRTGVHAALTFLVLNAIQLNLTSEQVINLGLDIANNKLSFKETAEFFKANTTYIKQ